MNLLTTEDSFNISLCKPDVHEIAFENYLSTADFNYQKSSHAFNQTDVSGNLVLQVKAQGYV